MPRPLAVRSLAAVFAHPDDEVFSMGGTLAHFTAGGGRFALYCATPGDAGRASGLPVASREELASLRRAELIEGMRVLGGGDIVCGRWRDGELGRGDTDALVGEIVHFLRERRPDVVVTFGPEGAPTGHRDHRAISRAATAAYFLAGRASEYPEQLAAGLRPHAPRRLYYVTWPDPPLDAPNRHEGQPITVEVDTRDTHDTELRSFLAHRSQRDSLDSFRRDSLTPAEHFSLAAGLRQPAPVVTDLFAGLD